VGKSSYINRLLRSDRVIVSDVPGTTRDSIDVPFIVGHGDQARHYVMVDTAGMRRVGKIDSSVERFSHFRSERSIRDADVVVLVIDGSQGPTAQEKRIASLVAEEGKGCVVVVNKWDLVETTQTQYAPELLDAMPFLSYCPLVFISAETGYNIRRSVDAIDHVASQIQAELPTGMLNRTLEAAFARANPPRRQGKAMKLYYAVQVGTAPLKVRLFVNDPRIVTPEYRKYLVKQLRAAFGLEGAPVFLQFRGRDRGATEERGAGKARPKSASRRRDRSRRGGG
jgi:GTP-binding protein